VFFENVVMSLSQRLQKILQIQLLISQGVRAQARTLFSVGPALCQT
jgi:hypothetical protein